MKIEKSCGPIRVAVQV